MLKMKDSKTVPQAIMPIADFDNDFLPNPFIKNPMNGNSGIKKVILFIIKKLNTKSLTHKAFGVMFNFSIYSKNLYQPNEYF